MTTLDGLIGFKTATSEELPDAVAVMDPFRVVRLAGDALDQCRRRVPAGHLWAPRPQRTRSMPLGALSTPDQTLLTDQQRNSAPQERSSRVRQSSPSGGV